MATSDNPSVPLTGALDVAMGDVASPAPSASANGVPHTPSTGPAERAVTPAITQVQTPIPTSSSTPTMPTEAIAHGAPTRQYLNSQVTPALLEGMKMLAKEQPAQPLKALGEFLLRKAEEAEMRSAA